MQPYIFPYIHYFQLINAVDKFVMYDDVNFIKQGWINRNRILAGGKEFLFAVPLKNQSSFELIKNTQISEDKKWKGRLIMTIEQSYAKAPFLSETMNVIKNVFQSETKFISQLALLSILETCNYLDINTKFVLSSETYNNSFLKGQERIINICSIENTTQYFNTIAGLELYSKDEFRRNNIDMFFLRSQSIKYNQFDNTFIHGLSIIDVMMFNSKEEIKSMLKMYELV